MLNFEGDLAKPAEEAFVEFLSHPHDHKAAQVGSSAYGNGSVGLYCYPNEFRLTDVKQVSFGLTLFYDGPDPPAGLYDGLLNLSSTTTTIFQGTFTNFVTTQSIPIYDQ